MMFISILLFFLPPPLYYFFFSFLSYTVLSRTPCTYIIVIPTVYFRKITRKRKNEKKKIKLQLSKRKHRERSKILQYIELSMEKYSPSVPRPFHQILETFQSNCTVIRRYSRKSIVHYQPRSP